MGILQRFLPLVVLILWAPAVVSIGDVNLSAVFFAAAFSYVLARKKIRLRIAYTKDTLPIIGLVGSCFYLCVFALFSAAWAEEPLKTPRMAYGQFIGLVATLLFVTAESEESTWNAVVKYMFWGCIISSCVCVLAYYVTPLKSLLFADKDRTAAFFKQANQLGIALSLAAPLVICYPLSKGRGWVSVLAFAISLFLGLAFSGSKTNLVLGGFASICALIVSMHIMRFPTKHPLATLAIIAIAPLFVIASIEILEVVNPRAFRLLQQFTEDGSAPSVDIRGEVWSDAISHGLLHPLLGVGAGQMAFGGRFSHSHNVFADYFRCLGVTGLMAIILQISCLVVICLSSLRDAIVKRSERYDLRLLTAGLAIGVLTYIVSNQMSDSFGPSTIPLMWMCFGCMYMLRRRLARSDETSH